MLPVIATNVQVVDLFFEQVFGFAISQTVITTNRQLFLIWKERCLDIPDRFTKIHKKHEMNDAIFTMQFYMIGVVSAHNLAAMFL